MPKLKTHSGLRKRIKFSRSGKVIASYGYSRHNRRSKSSRALKNIGTKIASTAETKMIKKMRCGSLR